MNRTDGVAIAAGDTERGTEPPVPAARSGLIVGIGASAGGLEAYRSFFSAMPADSGMAFVLIQHLSPDHTSMLAELLGKSTAMEVIEAVDGVEVKPNCVFVIPPDATMTIASKHLKIVKPAPPRDRRRPIDTFFQSLAEDKGENAVCIILAGTGSDGTLAWDLSEEYGDDDVIDVGAAPLGEQWYAGEVGAGQFVVDFGGDVDAIYHLDDLGLHLHALASREPDPPGGRTLLVYDAPVTVLRLPLRDGATWTATGTVFAGELDGLPYVGTDTYRVEVDGELSTCEPMTRVPLGQLYVLK